MSWLYRVATNQFYDLKRKETRHPTTELEEVQLTSFIHIPEIQMLKKEKLKDIQNTLETLSILHQELLILKYELGLSYKEISALMNKNENTLKRMSDVLGKNLLNDLRRMLMMNKEENEFLFDDRQTKK